MRALRPAAGVAIAAALLLSGCGFARDQLPLATVPPTTAELRASACASYRTASAFFEETAALLFRVRETPYFTGIVAAQAPGMAAAYDRLPGGRLADGVPQHLYLAYGDYVLAAQYARSGDTGRARALVFTFYDSVFVALQDPGRASLCTR